MNLWDAKFDALYVRQTYMLGYEIRATIGASVTNAKAILSNVRDDDVAEEGGTGQRGGYELQIKASDFSFDPDHDASVVCNGAATGRDLVMTSFENRGGVYLVNIGDPQF